MKLFRSKERSNANPAMMRNIAMVMDDEDIESVAAYIITLTKQPKIKNWLFDDMQHPYLAGI